MVLRLDIGNRTIDEMRESMSGGEPVGFRFTDRRGACDFVRRALVRVDLAD